MKPLLLALLLMGSLSVGSCSSTVKEITQVDTLHSEIDDFEIYRIKEQLWRDSALHEIASGHFKTLK